MFLNNWFTLDAAIKVDKRCKMLFAGLLTKKFLGLIQEAEDGILDLNHTAKLLQVHIML